MQLDTPKERTRPNRVRPNQLITLSGRGKLLNVLPLGLCRALWITCGIFAWIATDFFSLPEHSGSSDRPR